MSTSKLSLGQAIDAILAAMEPLEAASRQVALDAVCAQLGIRHSAPEARAVSIASVPAFPLPGDGVVTKVTDIRTLKEQKQPKSAKQMACLVAYYLQELAPLPERKASITTADIETYFKEAGYRLPEKIKQLLIDAKGAGYFKSVARGEYSLNAVGYNLVVHGMPSAKA